MTDDTPTDDSDWVDAKITEKEAQRFVELWDKIAEEQQAQLDKQGIGSGPASYKSLVRSPRRYVEDRYIENDDC